MLEQLIYLSPLLVLLVGIAVYALVNFKHDETYKCFKFSRILLVISLVLNIIFYNKPIMAEITSANKLTTTFIVWLYVALLILLFAARKWFSNMKQSGGQFCYMVLLTAATGCLLIVSKNLLLTVASMILFMFGNYELLLKIGNFKQNDISHKVYLGTASMCSALLLTALFVVYEGGGGLDYDSVSAYLSEHIHNPLVFAAAGALVLGYMFLFAAAPLHYWLTETAGKVSLPVFTYFLTVPVGAYLVSFIRLGIKVLQPVNERFQLFYVAVALMSMFVGAIGACSGQNIRKILCYTNVYCIGIIFLVLQHFTPWAAQTAIIYWFVCMLSLYGICLAMFCIKVKGEYLFMLNEFSGVAYKLPFLTIMIIFFLFSLLGMPPFIGALGIFSVLSNLALQNHFYYLLYVLFTLIIMAYAFLNIIRTFCFEDSRNNFDRPDSDISALLLCLAGLMIYFVLQPQHLLAQPWLIEAL